MLELGPLEGAHSWLLVSQGAASVTAVEANRRAYLKCLVMKEVLGTERVRVLLGDCVDHLAEPPEPRYDLAVASGVLYHMTDPVTLLARLAARRGSALPLHLLLRPGGHRRPAAARRPLPGQRDRATSQGFAHQLHVHSYQAARFHPAFCGGPAPSSRWLSRDDLLGALRHVGFADVEVGLDEPAHPNGPVLALVARQRRARRGTPFR